MAGRWYPLEYLGLVLGIAVAGNSGTLVALHHATLRNFDLCQKTKCESEPAFPYG